MAAFIAAQRDEQQIPHVVACRAKWRHGDPSPRHARRVALAAEVARLFAAHRGGTARITADLHEAGWRVSANTVAALMREQGLVARARQRRRHTTRPGGQRPGVHP